MSVTGSSKLSQMSSLVLKTTDISLGMGVETGFSSSGTSSMEAVKGIVESIHSGFTDLMDARIRESMHSGFTDSFSNLE